MVMRKGRECGAIPAFCEGTSSVRVRGGGSREDERSYLISKVPFGIVTRCAS